jgi:SRSO17 transposase
MHHFVADAPWSDEAVLELCREYAVPLLEKQGGIDALIIDDTGIPKKGTHSVGVGRQHCGQLGKVANCQVLVTLSLAGVAGSVPVAHRLYLPKKWTDDPERCKKAKVPEGIEFATKPEIALAELDELIEAGVEIPRVLGDAAYGDPSEFRAALSDRAVMYTLGVTYSTLVWRPGQQALPPSPRGKYLRWDDEHQPIRAEELALEHADDFAEVEWTEGTKGTLKSRFAAVRVRPAQSDKQRTEPWPVEWLLIEWPESEEAPTRYWLSTEPEGTPIERLVYLAKLRWRIERDYQELKDEIGMDHYEGRSWRGLHHHVTLCVAAYVFLMAERLRLSPPGDIAGLQLPALPQGFQPRGASSTS